MGRVDIVISDLVAGHTLVDIVIAEPTHRDLVDRVAKRGLVRGGCKVAANKTSKMHTRTKMAKGRI